MGHSQNPFSCLPLHSKISKSGLITLYFPTTPQKPPENSHETLSKVIKAPELKHKDPEEGAPGAPWEVP